MQWSSVFLRLKQYQSWSANVQAFQQPIAALFGQWHSDELTSVRSNGTIKDNYKDVWVQQFRVDMQQLSKVDGGALFLKVLDKRFVWLFTGREEHQDFAIMFQSLQVSALRVREIGIVLAPPKQGSLSSCKTKMHLQKSWLYTEAVRDSSAHAQMKRTPIVHEQLFTCPVITNGIKCQAQPMNRKLLCLHIRFRTSLPMF